MIINYFVYETRICLRRKIVKKKKNDKVKKKKPRRRNQSTTRRSLASGRHYERRDGKRRHTPCVLWSYDRKFNRTYKTYK